MNDRLQIAAMCLQGLLSVENGESYESKVGLAIFCADALLAECGEGDVSDCDVTIDAYDRGYQAGLQATQPRKVEVTDEMVETYCNAVAEHLGAMSHDEWERDRADPVTHAHRVAKVGLTAVLSDLNLPVGGDA